MGAFNSIDRASPAPSSPPNPDPTPPIPMSDSPSQPQPPPTEQPQLDPKPSSEKESAAAEIGEGEGEEEDEEEQGECGFCLFMKGGGCKESFVAWENCIEEAEKNKEDIAQKCFDLTSALRTCMLAHPDYYEPILRAEKAAEEEAIRELDKEKAAEEEVVIELENEKKTPAASSSEEKQ